MSSRSPFLPPPRRSRYRSRRRTRQTLGAVALMGIFSIGLVVAVAFLATHIVSSAGGGSPRAAALARAGHTGQEQQGHGGSQAARGGAAPGPTSAGAATVTPTSTAPVLSLQFHRPPRAALLFDVGTGKVLWYLNPTQQLPIASLTKMMTALLVTTSQPPSAHALITRRAFDAAGSKVGVLPVGKYVPLETLMYGLLLPSGNDAAVALAERVSGTVPRFVARMNEEAQHLGLHCTHYVSPDGIEDANVSCAADLATLARLDLAQPRIARIAATPSTVQPLPIKGGKVWLYNNNPLLRFEYPGAIGLKTGQTETAGRCLVGIARRDGVTLGVVLLDSPELGRQAERLLDAGFYDIYHLPVQPAPPVPLGM